MKKTIYLKFLMAYLIFGIFGFIIVSTLAPNMLNKQLTMEKSADIYSKASLIVENYGVKLDRSEFTSDFVQEQMETLSIFLDTSIWFISSSGKLILSTDGRFEDGFVIDGFDSSLINGSYYMQGNFFNCFEEDMLSVMAPILSDYKVKGYVVIHSPMSLVNDQAGKLLSTCYLVFIIMFLLSLIILLYFTEMVYLPLRKITKATEQYASGNMHYEFVVESDDEIGYLAACLGYMANTIAGSEDDQKKFVANVSHDFRSPLTSIRGYLEAMLDGTIPPEMYEKYLKIVLNETERLTKLTNSLLTLNNLNNKGVLLDKTDFDINEIIRNVAASFEGTCTQKDISIKLTLTGDSLFVYADLEKIQQVLYNLTDNAIKFSNKHSEIHIETTIKRSKLFVSVKDFGIGIPKDNLKNIWDRFYKSDLSRGKDKKGTGLGLSIVREIIRAHEEHINVISTEGIGTEFIFSLPISESTLEED